MEHNETPSPVGESSERRRIPVVFIVTAVVILVVTLVQVSLLFL